MDIDKEREEIKKNQLKRKIKIVLMLIVGLTSIYFTGKVLKFWGKKTTGEVVLFAVDSIDRGSLLAVNTTKWKEVDPQKITESSLTGSKYKEEDIINLVARKHINKDDEITIAMVVDKRKNNYINKVMKTGYRAFSLSFPSNIVKNQNIQPGCYVDIGVTYLQENSDNLESKIIIHNTKILDVSEVEKNKYEVLLEVKPEQVELITDSQRRGTFFLSLLMEEESLVKEKNIKSDEGASSIIKVIRRNKKSGNGKK
jgi:Flp pilus assembly protein CpaB